LFAYEPPSEQALAEYYAKFYRQYENVDLPVTDSWLGPYVRARSQIDFVGPKKHRASWLDIGAGYGRLLDEVRKNGFERTAGVELGGQINPPHVFYRSIDEVRDVWSVVSFSHVLEHFADPNRFLIKLKPLLEPNGIAFCEVPNEIWSDRKNDTPHLVFYTPQALQCVFEKNGFRVLRVDTCGPVYNRQAKSERILRQVGRHFWRQPPRWFDRMCHAEFHYGGPRSRIRLLAALN